MSMTMTFHFNIFWIDTRMLVSDAGRFGFDLEYLILWKIDAKISIAVGQIYFSGQRIVNYNKDGL